MSSEAGKNFLLKVGRLVGTVAEVRTLIYSADVDGNTNNSFTKIFTPLNKYVVWNNVGGNGVDPAIPGFISIEVAYAEGAINTVRSAAAEAAIDAVTDLTAVDVAGTVTVTNDALGDVDDSSNGTEVNPLIAVATTIQGDDSQSFNCFGGIKSHSFALNNEAIEITNYKSEEFRELLDKAGIRTVDLSGSGVFTDALNEQFMQDRAFDGKLINMNIVDDETGDFFSGLFKVTSMELSGEHAGEKSWTTALSSSGKVTHTRAA